MEKDKPLLRQSKGVSPFSASAIKTIDKDTLLFSAVCLLAFFFVLLTVLNTLHSNNQYVYLASSFLHGRLDFMQKPRFWDDTSLFNGKYYWPLGPLPAVLLMPFYLLFSFGADNGYLGIALTVLNGWFLYKLAVVLGAPGKTARWLAFAFIFATSFCYVNYFSTWAWYFANMLAIFLMLVALYEWYTRKRLFLVGLLIGLSMAARPLTGLTILSFIWFIFREKRPFGEKIRAWAALLILFGAVGLALMAYNYARFGSVLEFGYTYQIMNGEALATRAYGVWSLQHYPMNLYYLLFKGFDAVYVPGTKVLQPPYFRPDVWGTSILFTSPVLLFMIRARKKIAGMGVFLLNALGILLLAMAFWNTGMITYGSRHVLDFFPLLFPAFVASFEDGVSGKVKALIVFSFLFNFVMSLLVFTNL